MSSKGNKKLVLPQVVQPRPRETVIAFLYNAARPILSPEDREKYRARNREIEPWVVVLPSLGVVSTIVDRDGDPVVGKISLDYGSLFTELLYNRLVNDPELLASYRAKNDMPKVDAEYMGKIIPVTFKA